MNKSRNSDP